MCESEDESFESRFHELGGCYSISFRWRTVSDAEMLISWRKPELQEPDFLLIFETLTK